MKSNTMTPAMYLMPGRERGTWIECGKDYRKGRAFFFASPAPAVPDKMSFNDAVAFVRINGMALENRETLAMRTWNACRAATLNHTGDSTEKAEPVTAAYRLADLTLAVNTLLDNDGSRGRFSAIGRYDALQEVERLIATTPTQEGR